MVQSSNPVLVCIVSALGAEAHPAAGCQQTMLQCTRPAVSMPGRAKGVNGKARSPGWAVVQGVRERRRRGGERRGGEGRPKGQEEQKAHKHSGAVRPWLAEQAEAGEWRHVGIYSEVVSEGKLDRHRPGVRQDL